MDTEYSSKERGIDLTARRGRVVYSFHIFNPRSGCVGLYMRPLHTSVVYVRCILSRVKN
jgi:hypothetical protein